MALRLPDKWIWDSWYAFDGERHHAFYLHASRALGDPERRHRHPIVGHAVSDDLVTWTVVEDALIVSNPPAFDSWTTWTGSVVRDDDGMWWMFYTGTSREDGGDIQRIGAATSPDLMTWSKVSSDALVEADAEHYERLDLTAWHDEAWRDPWVFRFPGESEWQMLITARAKEGDPRSRGVMGHATSPDLREWTVQPPLSKPGQGFGQLEVFQFEVVDGVPIVLFCCGWREYADERITQEGQVSGTFSVACGPRFEDLDFTKAERFSELYAARLVHDPSTGWNLIGFIDNVDGSFVGELSDPVPVTADPARGLVRR